MKAALFYGGKDIRVEEVPDPVPGPGEVLVQVKAVGICGSDLHSYRDPSRLWPGLIIPYLSGHELAGEVAALGPGVSGLQVGDRVGVEPRHLVGCGECRWCRGGDYHACPNRGRVGGVPRHSSGFAEFDAAPQRNGYLLPDHVSREEASVLDVYACVVHVDVVIEAMGDLVLTFGTDLKMVGRSGTLGIIGMFSKLQSLGMREAVAQEIRIT